MLKFILVIFLNLINHFITAQDPCRSTIEVKEEISVGSKVVDLHDMFSACLITIGVATENINPEFKLLESSLFFKLESTILSMKSLLDREKLCESDNLCCANTNQDKCKIELILMSNLKSNSQYFHLSVKIIDINDNRPNWKTLTSHRQKIFKYGDEAPMPIWSLNISEFAEAGSKFALPLASDPDSEPDNSIASYRIKEQSRPGSFELYSEKDHNKLIPYLLLKGSNLDPDQLSNHQVIIEASDNGKPEPLVGYLKVNITILDENNHPPVLQNKSIKVRVDENFRNKEKPIYLVYKVKAFDKDKIDNGKLRYSFSSSMDDHFNSIFRIDSITGEVFVKGSIDYELRSTYNLPITVTDGKYSDKGNIEIEVQNLNDNFPVLRLTALDTVTASPTELITNMSVNSANFMGFQIKENSEPNLWIATLSYEDPDDKNKHTLSENRKTVICTTKNNIIKVEPLNLPTSGVSQNSNKHLFKLMTGSELLDREKKSRYSIKIECPDSGIGKNSVYQQHLHSSIIDVEIVVKDENDNKPQFMNYYSNVNITENSPERTLVTTVIAFDQDDENTLNGKLGLRYRLNGDHIPRFRNQSSHSNMPPQPWFNLDPFSGELRSLISFDAEVLDNIIVPISVSDGGDYSTIGHYTDNATFEVNIIDTNDCSPQFNQSVFALSVKENSKPPLQLGTVFAMDCDSSTQNNQLIYWLDHYNDPQLDAAIISASKSLLNWLSVSKNGDIFFQIPKSYKQSSYFNSFLNGQGHPLDRDKTQVDVYKFQIHVKDSGHPPRNNSAILELHIEDVNDHTPEWEFPSSKGKRNRINITFDMNEGSRITQLKAVDPDKGSNGQLSFRIIRGNENDQFQVEESTGWIYLNNKINRSQYHTDPYRPMIQYGYPIFQLFLEVSDHGDPRRNATANLEIRVMDQAQLTEADLQSRSRELQQYRSLGQIGSLNNRTMNQSDFLILIAMVVATLAALLLIIVMLAVFKCKRWNSGPQRPQEGNKITVSQLTRPRSINGQPMGTIFLAKPDEAKQKYYTINSGNNNPLLARMTAIPKYAGNNRTVSYYVQPDMELISRKSNTINSTDYSALIQTSCSTDDHGRNIELLSRSSNPRRPDGNSSEGSCSSPQGVNTPSNSRNHKYDLVQRRSELIHPENFLVNTEFQKTLLRSPFLKFDNNGEQEDATNYPSKPIYQPNEPAASLLNNDFSTSNNLFIIQDSKLNQAYTALRFTPSTTDTLDYDESKDYSNTVNQPASFV